MQTVYKLMEFLVFLLGGQGEIRKQAELLGLCKYDGQG
jgi:hypothetical protein